MMKILRCAGKYHGEHGSCSFKRRRHCADPLQRGAALPPLNTAPHSPPVYVAAEQGKKIKVFADETRRPLLAGARLTAFELTNAGIDTTVICDNMAAKVMSEGKVNAHLSWLPT